MIKRFSLTLTLLTLSASSLAQDALPDAVKNIEKQGITIIKPFTAPGGVQGWLGSYQGMGVTIYLTPDGKHAISGYMYDEKGNNLSEALIQQEVYVPAGREMWQKLQQAPYITEGAKDAPRKIIVFADPFCPYCKQFWQQAQPWVKAGKVQLQTLLVGVIKPESGRYAAAILAASDPAKAWHEYELSNGKTVPPFPEASSRNIWNNIQHNQRLMDELGANVTPAIYYLNDKNELQQVVGLPDEQQLAEMMGQ
ncbi:thiol:disulfide interchange protein DsbG [Pectobacterium carotovorum subsp. carotovorum]|nr:thiol:disulfide interchange protein DsbG [Pectobacterium carotovorum subsp. carotovorum]